MVMKNRFRLIFAISALLAACAPSTAAEPTLDIGAIQTLAVQTAVMEITVQAILHPSSTPIPQTAVQTPAVPLHTAVPGLASNGADGNSGGGSGGSGGSLGTPLATRTPDVYICEYVSQAPADKPQMTGANYDMVWTIRNTGIVTWNTSEYYIKWLGGSDLSPHHTYPLLKNVAPSDSIDIVVDINIPTEPMTDLQVTRWGIVNDNGDVFCKFYHAIPSTYPPSATPTPSN
jgi:hypothetical protein